MLKQILQPQEKSSERPLSFKLLQPKHVSFMSSYFILIRCQFLPDESSQTLLAPAAVVVSRASVGRERFSVCVSSVGSETPVQVHEASLSRIFCFVLSPLVSWFRVSGAQISRCQGKPTSGSNVEVSSHILPPVSSAAAGRRQEVEELGYQIIRSGGQRSRREGIVGPTTGGGGVRTRDTMSDM